MKLIRNLILIIVVIIAVAIFGRDVIVKGAIEIGAPVALGTRMTVESFHIGLLSSSVHIKNFRIYNPAGFKDPLMLDMPEFFVDLNLKDTLAGTIHVTSVRVNLAECALIKNEKGVDNTSIFMKKAPAEKKPAPQEKPSQPKKEGAAPQFKLDNLSLILGKVIFKNYARGGEPIVNEYAFNLNESYRDISNPYAVVAIIAQKILLKASLAQFDMGNISNNLTAVTGDLNALAGNATAVAGQAVTGVLDATKDLTKNVPVSDVTGSAQEAAAKTADTLKEGAAKLKGLAGKVKF